MQKRKKGDPTTLETYWINAWAFASGGEQKGEREYYFHETRKWRFDFAWQAERVAVEMEGGQWGKGRKSEDGCPLCGRQQQMGHQTGKGLQDNCEKYNAAALDGWLVFRFTTDMISKSTVQCVEMVVAALRKRREGVR